MERSDGEEDRGREERTGGSHKANSSSKPLTGKTRWVDDSFHNNQQSSKTGVLEVCTWLVWSLVGAVVLLWRRRQETWEQTVQSKDPEMY